MKRIIVLLLLQFAVYTAFAQLSLIGIVLGEYDEPLPGASVVIQNTYNGISAGRDGRFEFQHLKPGKYTLIVSFIGFESETTEVTLPQVNTLRIEMKPAVIFTEEVLVSATRAGEKMPFAFSTIRKDELQKRNMGQDLPFLLALSPSFVSTSDAGTGIGYSNFRVRGTDMNRINITVNGIPLNDPESHSTFFVDQPDLASSTDNIQIQRGVGTSTNGAAAFGATINLQTLALNSVAYAGISSAAGSFNTFKNTLSMGTGLLKNRFSVDARLSKISTDGFIDRAFSNLKSFYVSAGYYTSKSVLKAIAFSGLEETYQAWNGVPSVRLENDLTGIKRYEEHYLYSAVETAHMIASNPRTYNLYTYKNQVDLYQQDNFQLHFSHKVNPALNINAALHYTIGSGYYEQFKANQKFANYGMTKPVINGSEIARTDLVRRKWLGNDFYGSIFSANYKKEKVSVSWGGGLNQYDGNHFGKIIWAKYAGNSPLNFEWYRNTGLKSDFNTFAKLNYEIAERLNLFADVQYRHIAYTINGIDDDLRSLKQKHRFNFFNPKIGVFYLPAANQTLYFSVAQANREPNRDNYIDADPHGSKPKPEKMTDFETGYQINKTLFKAGVNLYFMNYSDQLVLTGQINDVGAPIMVNVDKSYRAGVELNWGVKIFRSLQWDANATLSRNKIRNFTEFVDDWDTSIQKSIGLGSTGLAFSPQVIANSQLRFSPVKNLSVNLSSSFVDKQYIDNTSSDDRRIEAYFINNLKADYTLKSNLFSEINFHLLVNNIFDVEYESNAWVYSYITGGTRYKMDGYFPQAGRHFMFGIDLKL